MNAKRMQTVGLMILLCGGMFAEGFKFRAIVDNNYIGYSDDRYRLTSENVLLFYASPVFIPSARIILSKSP